MEILPNAHTEALPEQDCPSEAIGNHRDRALRFMQLGDEAYERNAFDEAGKYYRQALRAHHLAADAATLAYQEIPEPAADIVCFAFNGVIRLARRQPCVVVCLVKAKTSEYSGRRFFGRIGYRDARKANEEYCRMLSEHDASRSVSYPVKKQIRISPVTLKARSALADCYYSLANLADVLSELDEAESDFRHCLSLLQNIVSETGSLHASRKVWLICKELSEVARRQEDYDKAMTYCQQALELAQTLEQETKQLSESRLVAKSRYLLAETASAQGDHLRAEEHYRHALDIYLAVARTDVSEISLRDLASAYYRLGDTAMEQGAFATAADCYRRWSEVSLERDRMLSNDPAKTLAAYHFKIALVSDGKEKAAHLQEALRLFTALHEADPKNPLYIYSLESVRSALDDL